MSCTKDLQQRGWFTQVKFQVWPYKLLGTIWIFWELRFKLPCSSNPPLYLTYYMSHSNASNYYPEFRCCWVMFDIWTQDKIPFFLGNQSETSSQLSPLCLGRVRHTSKTTVTWFISDNFSFLIGILSPNNNTDTVTHFNVLYKSSQNYDLIWINEMIE